MKESRTRTIKNKIFKKEDLKNIFAVFDDEYQKSPQKDRASLTFRVSCDDSNEYTSDSDDVLKDSDIIDIKKSKRISINYSDYNLHKELSFLLEEGKFHYSSITVMGDDRNWVSGKFEQLLNIINSIKDQKIRKYEIGIVLIVCCFVFFIFSRIIFLGLKLAGNDLSIWDYVAIIAMIGPFIFMVCVWIMDWFLNKYWPSIEFDFGPEDQRVKNKRKPIKIILSILFFTIILSVVLNLFSSYIYDKFIK